MNHHMTPAGKEALRKTIRGLRESLIAQIKEEAERVYRLGVSLEKAKLSEANASRRARLEAWVEEQSRTDWPKSKKGAQAGGAPKKPSEKQQKELRGRYLTIAVKEAAHTLINRLVIVRLMEAGELSQPAVVTGGWSSAGYREFQEYAGALCRDANDGTKGYGALLQMLFDELAVELPGVFGKVGLTSLFPIPAATLRETVEALNEPALDSVWRDDTTLGWVYQFWNDPEREALDEKINGGGKIEPHEIASKTQMFTERYMVEWLLQNSLGQTWLAMCKKNGFTPEFEQVRARLEARRAGWRKKREAGEVAPDELMPLQPAGPDGDLEEHWKYWVPQPLPDDAPQAAPERLLELKLLDPACGSGHFLVIAFDLLGALYLEEARARGEELEPVVIAADILEHNLYGVDIDARAIQIAAAALYLKAKLWVKERAEKVQSPHDDLRIIRMNLVAPTFKLGALPKDDAALIELKKRLKIEVGIPESLTESLVSALEGVDHLGTLLRVDKDVREAVEKASALGARKAGQGDLFQANLDEAEANVTEQLARFLDAHEGESDLGLRLEGEQLAAGVRFLQMVREGTFDVVVGNPPYQGTSKMADADWFKKHYPRSKADLYACFLERGLELAKPGGVSALLTMRGWMFLSSYQELREGLLGENELSVLGDIDRGGFADIPDEVVAASMSLFAKRHTEHQTAVAIQPTPLEDKSRDSGRTSRKKAALLAQVGRFEFDVAKLAGIEGTPLVYWWSEEFLEEYVKAPKLGEVSPGREGINTGDNGRFTRTWWEVERRNLVVASCEQEHPELAYEWMPVVSGGKGRRWMEDLERCINWRARGLELKVNVVRKFDDAGLGWKVANEDRYMAPGVAFTTIGTSFGARLHRYRSIFDGKGRSVFPEIAKRAELLCLMNTRLAHLTIASLNPGVDFAVGDVNRLAVIEVPAADVIANQIASTFTLHESHREPSVEFKEPGPSPWRSAQDWAQRAVDRPKGAPLPPYEEELDAPEPTAFVSFAIGVALGRFGENGEGILDLSLAAGDRAGADRAADGRAETAKRAQTKALFGETGQSRAGANISNQTDLAHGVRDSAPENMSYDMSLKVPNIEPAPLPDGQEILPHGILFVSQAPSVADSTKHPAYARVARAWEEHGANVTGGKKTSLEEWLAKEFFSYHKALYENRPIYFPLTSAGKSFVAWVSIHRWADNTLQTLLASYLHPAREKLQGEIHDLNQARVSSDKKAAAAAEKQYAKTQKLFEELEAFIASVTEIAEKGAPPTDNPGSKNGCPAREVDAPFRMDLDDGVMINSAALWPLLEPQWKDPKKWWKELATADGRKDYDWAHLAARYFPKRVDAKCKEDPSLGVAHGCFWKYHPQKAYAWELRLQDEIAPEFTIDEPDSNACREAFLRDFPETAAEIRAKEEQRRERNRKKGAKAGDEEADAQGSFELRAE